MLPPPDAVAPTAVISSAGVTAAGAATHAVQVVYSDNVAVNVATIDPADITVTGPGGALAVSGVQISPSVNGSPITATYAIVPPGGTWDAADNGAYTITLAAGAATDTTGNQVAAGTGTFNVSIGVIPPPPAGGPDLTVAAVIGPKRGLPPSVVGGAKGVVRVQVTNSGDAPVAGIMQVALAARPSGQTTSALDAPIVTTLPRPIRLRPGQSRFIPIKFNYPSTVADGPYFLVATADAASAITEGSELNNTGATATAVTIAAPFVDLAAVAVGSPPRGAIAIGRRSFVPVTVENLGNVPANGLLNVNIYASTDNVIGAGDILLGTVSRPLKLKNGARRVMKLSGVIDPAVLPPGTYFIGATINSPAAIPETTATNNTAVSATSFPAA